MKARIAQFKKIAVVSMVVLAAAAFFATAGHASAAVSINQCNNTSDVAACKKAFQKCDQQPKSDTCKEIYLNQQAQLGQLKAPPESDCNSTPDAAACKTAYEKCASGDNTCKQNAISDQNLKSVSNGHFNTGDNQYKTINDICGGTVDGQDEAVGISIKIGCQGKGNPIADATFAIIRILSDGVGLVVIASIIYGGIQYTGSRGDPQSTALAVNRIRSSVFALLIYIFGYAILNYLIPAGFLR